MEHDVETQIEVKPIAYPREILPLLNEMTRYEASIENFPDLIASCLIVIGFVVSSLDLGVTVPCTPRYCPQPSLSPSMFQVRSTPILCLFLKLD
jgi:hypothetical protein